jgi:hypothetical protein
MSTIYFDIETAPLPEKEILAMAGECPIQDLPPFNEADVKCGNMKDQVKIAEKISKAREDYARKILEVNASREEWVAEKIEKAALSPLTGWACAIGYLSSNDNYCVSTAKDQSEEPGVLQAFWGVVEQGHAFVGHNIHGFDIPFLIKRSWYWDIQVPAEMLGRYIPDRFIDTMLLWDRRSFIKLDILARFFGHQGKPDNCTGAEFAKMFLSGDPEKQEIALEYLRNDCDMTKFVANKMGVM